MSDTPQETVQVQPTVQPSSELPANASPEAFGAGVGQAQEQGAEVLQRLHADAVMHANKTVAEDNYNKLSQFESQRLYDPKTGVLNQNLGAKAPEAVDKTLEDHKKLTDEITGTLVNDQQKEQFQQLAIEHRSQMQRQLDGYEAKQVRGYQDGQTQAFIENNMNGIARSPTDLRGNWERIGRIRASVQMASERNNLSPEATKAAVEGATAEAHLTVIRGMADGGMDIAAKSYFDDHKDELDARTMSQAQRLVEKSSTDGEAHRILHEFTLDKDGQPVSRQEFLKRLDSDPRLADNVKLYDEVEKRGEHFVAQHEQAYREDQTVKLDAVQMAIDKDPSSVPPSLLEGVDAKGLQAAEKYRQWKIKDQEPKDDAHVFGSIKQMLADTENLKTTVGDGSGGGTFDLNVHKADLSPATFKHLQGEIEAARKQVSSRDIVYSQGKVATDVSNRLFKENGLEITAKKGTPEEAAQAQLQGRFMLQLHRALGALQIEQQKPATPEQVDIEAKKLLVQNTWITNEDNPLGPQHDTGFGNWIARNIPHPSFLDHPSTVPLEHTARAFEMPGADRMAYSVSDIPKDYAARQALHDKKHGARTDKQRLDDYNEVIMREPSK